MFLRPVFLCYALFAIMAAPVVAVAQESPRTLERLSDLNRISPLQNPEFERAEDVLGRKILDRKNKVIGEVKDITLRNNGTINTINTDFDRLRLGNTVFLDFREMSIRPVSDAYSLAMDSDEIAAFYPQLLANIDTAAGNEDDSFSTLKIVGSKVEAVDGRNLGSVKSVLFGSNGTRASALYVELSIGTTRGDYVAIPFRSADLQANGSALKAVVSNDLANAMIDIADN